MLQIIKYFSVVDHKSYTNQVFCGYTQINGRPVSSIVSNDMSSAWATEDTNSPDNKYVEFLFSESKISVQGIALQTLCGPPNEIVFEGKKDDGLTWETVCS